jgi:hypothetical protein
MLSLLNTTFTTAVRKGVSVVNDLFKILQARSTYYENEAASKALVNKIKADGLLDKASIILTPTGYSKDAIHNVKPSSAPFGDMTLIQNGTTTRVNASGLVVDNTTDIPRIDYSKGAGAILSETAATNEIRYSEDFSNSLWTKGAIGLTSSTGTNPRGTNQTLYTITRQPASGDGLHAALASSATGNGVGMSIWIRRVSGPGSTGNVWIGREPESGAPMFSGVVHAIGSEWQRIEYKSVGYTGTSRMYINPQYSHNFQVWGAQTEKTGAGSNGKVSSYIPTTSTSVTRARDNYLNGGDSALIGQTEGVFYMEAATLANAGSKAIALSASNSAANRVVIFYSNTSNTIQGRLQASTSTVIAINGTVPSNTNFNKIAFKYKSGDLALWINGTEVQTSTGSFAFSNLLSELAFDQGNGTLHMDGLVKQVIVFKEALSDAELTALTS